jgi:hypothetical protein
MNLHSRLFIIFILSSVFFGGCTRTYDLSRYSSDDKFYSQLNDYLDNNEVQVFTEHDSTFVSESRSEIIRDSLNIYRLNISRNDMVIPLKLLGSVQYTEYYPGDHVSGILKMKDSTSYEAEGIEITPDSMHFVNVIHYETKSSININDINKITFKKRWAAVPLGIITGFASGFFIGMLSPLPIYEGGHGISSGPSDEPKSLGENIIVCSLSGLLIGGILAYLAGFEYEFNFR